MYNTMKSLYIFLTSLFFTSILLPNMLQGQSHAGGKFLLIAPGARAGGMGEAQLALANDVYATYYNPAGLGFQEHHELTGMHMQWLSGLVDDIYYEFAAYKGIIPGIGNIGIAFTYLNLGEQIHTGTLSSAELSRFQSYMWNASISHAVKLNGNVAIGVTAKIYRMFLAPQGLSESLQEIDGATTNFAFDVAYLNHHLFTDQLSFAAVLSNIGPNITFVDPGQADPAPTTLKFGVSYQPLSTANHLLALAYDVSQVLATRGTDGATMPFYTRFTNPGDGNISPWQNEILHNFGAEYWYKEMLAARLGGILRNNPGGNLQEMVPLPTFGAGLRLLNYGVDFGYLLGEKGHPLHNTMRFSANIIF